MKLRKTAAEKRAEQIELGKVLDQQFANAFREAYSKRLLQLVYDAIDCGEVCLTTTTHADIETGNELPCIRFTWQSVGAYTSFSTFEEFPLYIECSMYTPNMLRNIDSHIDDATYEIQSFLNAKELERIKAEKKKAALSKLTNEERELLGL